MEAAPIIEVPEDCQTAPVEASSSTLPTPSRQDICRLHAAMLPIACEQPEPGHLFAPGMYLRTLLVPAGMLIVGKTHRHDHFLMVMSGRAQVISEFGRDEVTAGHISVSRAGVKRAVLALEDTLFVTIHANHGDSQDLAVIEAEHIVPDQHEVIAASREVLQ